MKNLHFYDYEDFVLDVVDKYDSLTDEYDDISVIAKYDEIKNVIEELVRCGYPIASIEFHRPEFNDYYDEYILSLNFDGIWCQPMKYDENKYINEESKVAYIFDNCSSKVISHCKAAFLYEVSVGEDSDDEDCNLESNNDENNSEATYVSRSKDGTPEGFVKTWYTNDNGVNCYSSYAHYSSDIDDLKKIAEKFGIEL